MANVIYAIDYLGGLDVKAGTAITTATILATYAGATCMTIKSENVKLSINNTIQFKTTYDEEFYLTTGRTFTFDKDCILSIGIFKFAV